MTYKEAFAANSTPFDYLDYPDILELIDPQTDRIAGVMSVIYLLLAVVGILLNAFALIRLFALWKRQSDRFFESSALPLTTMAFSDLLSLIVIIVLVQFTFVFSEEAHNTGIAAAKCKVSIFLLHTSAGVSRWCWLFASSLRYAAVYHPLWHRRQWRLGHRTVPVILVVTIIVNIWLLFSVESVELHCTEAPLFNNIQVNRWMHGIEMTWSYLAPVCITAALDMRVLFLRPPPLHTMQQSQSDQTFDYNGFRKLSYSTSSWQTLITVSSNRRTNEGTENRGRSQTAVYHWLTITTINLLLTAPDFTLRLLAIFGSDLIDSFLFDSAIIYTVRLLYFVQFCINAGYLSTVVFRRPASSHCNEQKASKWPELSTLIVSWNVNNVVGSDSNSVPLLCLETLESWPEVNGCLF